MSLRETLSESDRRIASGKRRSLQDVTIAAGEESDSGELNPTISDCVALLCLVNTSLRCASDDNISSHPRYVTEFGSASQAHSVSRSRYNLPYSTTCVPEHTANRRSKNRALYTICQCRLNVSRAVCTTHWVAYPLADDV